MKFSERNGFKPIRTQIQIDSMDSDLRESLWNVYLIEFLQPLLYEGEPGITDYAKALMRDHLKEGFDSLALHRNGDVIEDKFRFFIKDRCFRSIRDWYEPYNLLEFTIPFENDDFVEEINTILEREKSGYRIIENHFVQIVSEVEIESIEMAFENTENIDPVQSHLQEALKLLADKKSTDFRNSVKESISAIESLSKYLTKSPKIKFGDAMNHFEKQHNMHPALKRGFSALYGYTSNEGGIRHALLDDDRPIDYYEAQFMFITCSAFINYLISFNNNE